MAGSSEEEQKKLKSGTEDSEDESEILEESPCGRWLKRREVVIRDAMFCVNLFNDDTTIFVYF